MGRERSFSTSWFALDNQDPQALWREGMVSGNGEQGYITAGAPYEDTYIFQNIWFNFPSDAPRYVPPELPDQLEEARRAVFERREGWQIVQPDAKGGWEPRARRQCYSFHPGMQLRLSFPEDGTPVRYQRWTAYETGETGVRYTNHSGEWTRTAFASRADGICVLRIRRSSENRNVNLVLSIDDIQSMCKADRLPQAAKQQYKKLVSTDGGFLALVAHYPSFAQSELWKGGYCCGAQVLVSCGSVRRVLLADGGDPSNVGKEKNPGVEITDAEEVCILVKSGRTHQMGTLEQFRRQEHYALAERLKKELRIAAGRYQTPKGFDYEAALAAHVRMQEPEFRKVALRLDSEEEDRMLSNEQLLAKQRSSPEKLLPAFLERAYQQGRFVQLACAGFSAPRLYGMWTGEWAPGWRSAYTMDANVNLQTAAINTGNMEDCLTGYVTFVLRNVPDWVENAKMSYGMHDAIQVPVNSDGDRSMQIEYDNSFPFQYWNAGGAWCLLPIYEAWQCRGNRKIKLSPFVSLEALNSTFGVEDGGLEELEVLKKRGVLDLEQDILLPLLTKNANFWEQLCTPEYYMDAQGREHYQKGKSELEAGETYLILPGFSPENRPLGQPGKLAANVTMDLSAARSSLDMIITLEEAVRRPGYEQAVEKWRRLKERLPAYQFTEDGALKEWAREGYQENDNHRHISHLYPVWPGFETQTDPELEAGAKKALENRNAYNTEDDTAGHGWIHKALVAARLKDGQGVENALLKMAAGTAYYTSFMTDHDSNRKKHVYCTDTVIGLTAAVNEALVFSDWGLIELLPALPPGWRKGEIRGLMARTRAEVRRLCWDREAERVTVEIRSLENANRIRLNCGLAWEYALVEGCRKTGGLTLFLDAGQCAEIEFILKREKQAGRERRNGGYDVQEGNQYGNHPDHERVFVYGAPVREGAGENI